MRHKNSVLGSLRFGRNTDRDLAYRYSLIRARVLRKNTGGASRRIILGQIRAQNRARVS